MKIALRCQCGKLRGEINLDGVATRAICYCKDCQAYARFLSSPPRLLDAAGGIDIVPTLPAALRFTQGIEQLACMSLGEKGLYRWYARCCRTPVGNTPRTPKLSYVGIPRALFDAPDALIDQQLGPARTTLNTESARSPVAATPVRVAWAVARIGKMIWGARLSGRYLNNPFFDPASRKPVCVVQVLSGAERAALE